MIVPAKLYHGLSTTSQLVVSACWIWAGFTKILSPDRFKEALLSHGVFMADDTRVLVSAVPIAELALGTAIIVLGTRKLPSVIVAAVSSLLLIVLSYYILMVPEDVLKASGCGCMGMPRNTEQSHVWPVGRNIALLALHPMLPVAAILARRASVGTRQT